jgi:formate dehydrogenase subunit gamma
MTRIERRALVIAGFALAAVIVAALLLPLGWWGASHLLPGFAAHAASEPAGPVNPRSEYWRAVRQGEQGYSAIRGQERGILIQHGGENWRQIRNGLIAGIGPWFLAGVLAAIFLFYIWRGRIRLREPRSGRTVPRWSAAERILHWYTATLFIVLTITGLSLLLGRALLIPVMGPQAFAAWAQAALYAHNYLGPFFAVGVLLIVVAWFRHNLPAREDWNWFRQGGGIIGNAHPHAGRLNAGEKVWYWVIATVGTAVIISGFVLDFPNFGQLRGTMQTAHIVHASLAILWIGVAFGHIYIGTLGTEGALEGMTTGRVSSEWARQHHDLWYEEVKHLETASESPSTDAEAPSLNGGRS